MTRFTKGFLVAQSAGPTPSYAIPKGELDGVMNRFLTYVTSIMSTVTRSTKTWFIMPNQNMPGQGKLRIPNTMREKRGWSNKVGHKRTRVRLDMA